MPHTESKRPRREGNHAARSRSDVRLNDYGHVKLTSWVNANVKVNGKTQDRHRPVGYPSGMRYRIDSGTLIVKAHSKVHDVTTKWNKISGAVEADPETLATDGAKATFTVDMTAFDAGDWLKNRKLKNDFEMDKHPEATFELRAVRDVAPSAAGSFKAAAEGVLRWRGKEVVLVLAGHGTLDRVKLEASATFDLDIRQLGLSAPRFLMIKMEDVVTIDVTIHGSVQP